MLVQGGFKHFNPNSFTLSLGAKIKKKNVGLYPSSNPGKILNTGLN